MRSEGFYVNENPLKPAGIEPTTFRFVVQHLNHCATAVPILIRVRGRKPNKCTFLATSGISVTISGITS